jgi:hypothetical protein
MRPLYRKALWITGISGLYVVACFGLMVRDVYVWKSGKVVFRSTYRFAAEGESPPGIALSMPEGAVSTWNYVFLPADWVFYSLADAKIVDSRFGNYIRSSNGRRK